MTNKAAAKAAFTRSGFLSEDEEFRLARLARSGDRRAMERLVRAYEPFARGMAHQHKSQMEFEDRLQIAMAALWQAATRFDPAHGRRLSAYAKFRIKRDLDDAGMKAASRVNLGNSKQRRSAHQNVLRVCAMLGIDPTNTLTDPQAQSVADEIGIKPHDVRAALQTGDAAFVFLDKPSPSDGCDQHDLLCDEIDTAELFEVREENEKRLAALDDALAELDEMDAEIIRTSVLAEKPQSVSGIIKRHGSKLTAADARQRAADSLEAAVGRIATQRGLMS